MAPSTPAAHARPAVAAYLAWAAALNAVFLVGHPFWTPLGASLLRSLLVGAVLLVAPGVPWVGLLIRRGWLGGLQWLAAVGVSLASLVVVLVAIRAFAIPLTSGAAYCGVWLLTNGGVLLNAVLGGPADWGVLPRDRFGWLGLALFLATWLGFYYRAAQVVPAQDEHDFDVLACGYGMLTRFEPLLVTDHDTVYQFSHPPLSYFCTAGSFLYFDKLDYLAYYDAASRRAWAAHHGIPFEPFQGDVDGLSGGRGRHRVIGLEGADYLLDPPLANGDRRTPVWLYENAVADEYFDHDPQLLPARTANIFLAAMTVALLGSWIGRATGRWPLAVLTSLVYATSPEVFVRSGYGGHFATTNFAALGVLMAVEQWSWGRAIDVGRAGSPSYEQEGWAACFVAAVFAALVNHKLILLPVAVVVWQFLWCRRPACGDEAGRMPTLQCRLASALLHPAVLGFALGTALFWCWGLAIDREEFWRDHIQTHFVNRVVHHTNLFAKVDYPTVAGLWYEFWQHTGYLLLPLGALALIFLSLPDRADAASHGDSPGFIPRQEGESQVDRFWLTWTCLAALAFSLVDWRQTKHLMPLLLPLTLATARWAASGRVRLLVAPLLLAATVVWNLYALAHLAADFSWMQPTAGW